MILLELMLFSFLIYFSIMFMFNAVAILLVVIITSLLLEHMKSAEILDLTVFKSLLMLEICILAYNMITLMFSLLISIIICFLNGLLVIMLILSLIFVHNVLYFNDFTRWQFKKHLFDFKNFLDIIFGGLSE